MFRFSLTKLLMLIAFAGLSFALIQLILEKPVIETPAAIAISPDGERVATISESGRSVVFDLRSGRQIGQRSFEFTDAEPDVVESKYDLRFVTADQIVVLRQLSLDLSYESNFAAYGFEVLKERKGLEFLYSWRINTGGVRSRFAELPAKGLVVSNGEFVLRTQPNHAKIDVHQASDNSLIKSINVRDRFSDDSSKRQPNNNLMEFTFYPYIPNLTISDDGKKLFVSDQLERDFGGGSRYAVGRLNVYDFENQYLLASTTRISHPKVSRTGKYALAYQDGKLQLFDEYLNSIATFANYTGQKNTLIEFSPDETMFAIKETEDSEILIYKLRGRTVVSRIPSDGKARFVFGANSQQLCVFPEDANFGIEVYDIADGQLLHRIGSLQKFWPMVWCVAGFVVWIVVAMWLFVRWLRKKFERDEAMEAEVVLGVDES